MAVFTGKAMSADVIGAAEHWRKRCLLDSLSVFTDNHLWTTANFDGLKRAFVDNPLLGPEPFIDKLLKQLQPASTEVKQLAAEALWLLYLFVSSDQFGQRLKRERIEQIWKLSGSRLPHSQMLDDPGLSGLANPGAAFMAKMPNELEYLITIMVAWKVLDREKQSSLLSDPWPLSDWLSTIPGSGSRGFRHMFLYFCFPDSFERICSWNHKRLILAEFGETGAIDREGLAGTVIDRRILGLRKRLESEYGTTDLDFYVPPLRNRWLKASEIGEPVHEPTAPRVWIEKTIVKSRPDRITGENALGRALWSPQRASGNRDIYANMRRVKVGDVVLHLTDNQAISHVSIAAAPVDESFEGISGTEWGTQASYRIQLRDAQELTPALKRDAFFRTEPYSSRLKELVIGGAKGLFYNVELELNQGAYLTQAPPELVEILDDAYRHISGKGLPFIDRPVNTAASPQSNTELEFTNDEVLRELFLEPDEVQSILTLWQAKKNIILQGPPGVGKSFAAQRLACLLIGSRTKDRTGFVQFHQSYSYEDFVQGYRPTQNGFELRNGKFVDFCVRAANDLQNRYVFIIDEINRGNLSKILGELMLLIEPDKRDKRWEMPLAYSSEPFHVPPNVHLIGLMNTADRSLAVVDYALRRRFAFMDLVPKIDSEKFRNVLLSAGVGDKLVELIRERVGRLNITITEDPANLGPGYMIGHSFFCTAPADNEDSLSWYGRVVRTEIVPLLREYWFDSPDKAKIWEDRLLADL